MRSECVGIINLDNKNDISFEIDTLIYIYLLTDIFIFFTINNF